MARSTCQYTQWSRNLHQLVNCEENGTELLVKGKRVCLCAQHRAFVLDAVNDYEVRLSRLKEQQRRARIKEQIGQLKMALTQGD